MVMKPEEAVLLSIQTAEQAILSGAMSADLLKLMDQADRELAKRLAKIVRRTEGLEPKFTEASIVAYRRQISLVRQFVQRRLAGQTTASATLAIRQALRNSVSVLEAFEMQFAGVVRPLRLAQATMMDRTVRGVRASLLAQHATSVDRYGMAMIAEFEKVIQKGFVTGASQREMVMALTGHGGPKGKVSLAAREIGGQVRRLREEFIPEGLFVRKKYWAERIVRTETAAAYNEAGVQGMYVQRDQFPDMGKKILATFDARTAYDSYAVHGQIRKLEELFIDGAGREYLRPPARPNDRETVIPWRMAWNNTASTKPPSVEEQIAAKLKRIGHRPGEQQQARADAALKARYERARTKAAKDVGDLP